MTKACPSEAEGVSPKREVSGGMPSGRGNWWSCPGPAESRLISKILLLCRLARITHHSVYRISVSREARYRFVKSTGILKSGSQRGIFRGLACVPALEG